MNTLLPERTRSLDTILGYILWPVAVITILHRTWAMPQNPNSTDDFTTVWRAVERFVNGVPVYNEEYTSVLPHYLYSPGATLLLSPMHLFGTYDTTRLLFAIIQAIAIVLAIVVLLRWYGVQRGSWVLPLVLVAAFHTEAVTNTLNFTNVNGSILLAIVLFLVLLTPRTLRANIASGVILGLALTIKPVVAPLLFLPFVRKQFLTIASALLVPIAANLIAWPLMNQPKDYLSITLPYLKIVRDYANSSLPGQLTWLGANSTLILLWQLFFAAFIITSLVLLLRWVNRDEIFWMSTTAGLLLAGAFFLSNLGQQYYSMLLFPLFLSFLRPIMGARDSHGMPAPTVVANYPAGLAIALCLFFGSWSIKSAPLFTNWLNVAIGAFGWGLLILAITAELVRMTIADQFAGHPFSSGLEWVRSWFSFGRPATPPSAGSTVQSDGTAHTLG